MEFYSTKHISPNTDLQNAVMQGLPDDNGLYMPERINTLPKSFFGEMGNMIFPEMAYRVAKCLLADSIEADALKKIVYEAVSFDAPLHRVSDRLSCLELFHGPSHAFKDFGARFMAQMMSHYVSRTASGKLYILVATSGDTGGAVAQGFLNAPGIEVIILYPSKKISDIQEKQLTTLSANITALEVEGVFDDCQRLVKAAFLDEDLRKRLTLSSANSINLARLVPQTFYYFRAYQQLPEGSKPPVICVPSGNFGNLTAGLIAHKMGLPVSRFVAANNANNVFTEYMRTGMFEARASVKTLSNAMDVGDPSNFQRILDLYDNDLDAIKQQISANSYTDEQTLQAIRNVYAEHDYVMCPHTAVGYLALHNYLNANPNETGEGIFLGTAHPAKFLDIVEPALNLKVEIPENLQVLMQRKKAATLMTPDFDGFKEYLMEL